VQLQTLVNRALKTFVKELKRIGRIRNDIMHFDPDGPSPDHLKTLRKFVKFLADL